MLEHTFCHIPGIGPTTEQTLWRQGIHIWEDALQPATLRDAHAAARPRRSSNRSAGLPPRPPGRQRRVLRPAWQPRPGLARLHSHFRDVVYLDIETTGFASDDKITLVGVSDGRTYTVFVAGQNLAELPAT